MLLSGHLTAPSILTGEWDRHSCSDKKVDILLLWSTFKMFRYANSYDIESRVTMCNTENNMDIAVDVVDEFDGQYVKTEGIALPFKVKHLPGIFLTYFFSLTYRNMYTNKEMKMIAVPRTVRYFTCIPA